MDEERAVFTEMCRAASLRRATRFSRFLNLAAQRDAEAVARQAGVEYALFGGHADCERKVFGVGYTQAPATGEFPISCVMVMRRGAKFAKPLEHRDVLGSVMGLGIDREVTGDIATVDGEAYVFCLTSMADYIASSLEKVGNAFVKCEIVPAPDAALRSSREIRVQVASVRIDAIVAHLFKLSRVQAQALFAQRKIAIDDVICEKCDADVKPGQVISARGFGRAKYIGVEGQSKKGKYNALIELYV